MTGLVSVGFLHPGYWSACFANSVIDLMFYDAAHRQRVAGNEFGLIGRECGAAQIHAGRNRIAQVVLDESPSEWLFMVDSDMGFEADTVDRLLESADPVDRPIVGALAFAQKSDGAAPMFARRYRCTPTLYRMRQTETEVGFTPMFDYPRGELVEVDATGAAAVLIHRDALAKIRADHGDHWYHPLEVPVGDGRTEFGEDMSFCLRAKACGIPIHVDTSVKTTHDKGGVFFDEDTYELQQAFKRGA